MEPIFQCTNLSKVYPGGRQALANVTLSVEPGHIVGLLGPNGSGKSTLIKLLSGLLTPSSGEVRVAGMVPGVQTKALVSYLPERSYLNDWMTVRDLLSFFEDFYADFDKAKAYDMLQRLQILSDERLRTMSKGTKEKVQLIQRRPAIALLRISCAGVTGSVCIR